MGDVQMALVIFSRKFPFAHALPFVPKTCLDLLREYKLKHLPNGRVMPTGPSLLFGAPGKIGP